MPLTREGFLNRLRSGKSAICIYQEDGKSGLINTWLHEQQFILTWEECLDGDQYNENEYTRDERYIFQSAEQLLIFLESTGYTAEQLSP
jgi:hypothetical protein